MRRNAMVKALMLLVTSLVSQAATAQSMETSVAPSGGTRPVVIIRPALGGSPNPAAARDVAAAIYHADRPGDMEVWLFERLMDRYSRAFDVIYAWNDPALNKAIQIERTSMRTRLQAIANRHAPILFEAAVGYFAHNYGDTQLHSMLEFARSDAGKKYFYWANIPYMEDHAVKGMLIDDSKLADEIIAEIRAAAPDSMAHHPELARAVIIAGGAIR